MVARRTAATLAILLLVALPFVGGQAVPSLPPPLLPKEDVPEVLEDDGTVATPGSPTSPFLQPDPNHALGKAVWPQCAQAQEPTSDCDTDGRTFAQEQAVGTLYDDFDSDNDWLSDGQEHAIGTDPLSKDTDSDCVPDWIERKRGMDPRSATDGNTDQDGDSYDLQPDGGKEILWTGCKEYLYHMPEEWNEDLNGPWLFGTDPRRVDSDGDLLTDAREVWFGADASVYQYSVRTHWFNTDAAADLPHVHTDGFADGDGLAFFHEKARGTGPYSLDTDGDGLCDGPTTETCAAALMSGEVDARTDPAKGDTDGDGLDDGIEVVAWNGAAPVPTAFGLIPPLGPGVLDADGDLIPGPIDPDNDGDGVTDGDELVHSTGLADPDSDRDGLLDGLEVLAGYEPTLADSDGDLLTDYTELWVERTDVMAGDTDGDGLQDGAEVLTLHSDPLRTDGDTDHVPDAFEVAHGMDPLVVDSHLDLDLDGLPAVQEFDLGTLPEFSDSKGDSAPDGWEYANGLDPAVFRGATSDTDSDGLADYLEYTWGTTPRLHDSDGDDLRDGDEVRIYATDPLDYDSDDDGLWDGEELHYWLTKSATAWTGSYTAVQPETPEACAADAPPMPPRQYSAPRQTPPVFDPCRYVGSDSQCDGKNNLLCWDSDGDGLNDHDEFVTSGTDPANAYSNADPVPTLNVVLNDLGWTLGHQLGHVYVRPGDQDGDGLGDSTETGTLHSQPDRVDSDCDALGDRFEVYYSTHGRPEWNENLGRWVIPVTTIGMPPYPWLVSDWDNDGVPDGTEANLAVMNPTYPFHSRLELGDTDDDGIGDGMEDALWERTPSCVDVPLPTAGQASAGASSPMSILSPSSVACSAGGPPPVGSVVLSLLVGTAIGSSPVLPDTDFDGLWDGCEVSIGTNVLNCDTDLDLLGDGLEYGIGPHFGIAPYSKDNPCTHIDRNTSSNSDPTNPNSDGDTCPAWGGLKDGQEDPGHDGTLTPRTDSDPMLRDSDGDGALDCDELVALYQEAVYRGNFNSLCALVASCDPDGIPDALDGPRGTGSNHRLPDMEGSYSHIWWGDAQDKEKAEPRLVGFRDDDQDGDGVFDNQEAEAGGIYDNPDGSLHPDGDMMEIGGATVGRGNLVDADSDDDGLLDEWERLGNDLVPLSELQMDVRDGDGDGLPDGQDIHPTRAVGAAREILNVDFTAGQFMYLDYLKGTFSFEEEHCNQEPYLDLLALTLTREQDASPVAKLGRDLLESKTKQNTDCDGYIKLDNFWLPSAPINFWDFPSVDGRLKPVGAVNEDDLLAYANGVDAASGNLRFFVRVRVMESDWDWTSPDDHVDINGDPGSDERDWYYPIDVGHLARGGLDVQDLPKKFVMDGWADNDCTPDVWEYCDDGGRLTIELKTKVKPEVVSGLIKHSCLLPFTQDCDAFATMGTTSKPVTVAG